MWAALDDMAARFESLGFSRPITVVPGIHRHQPTAGCDEDLPEVSAADFDRIRERAESVVWDNYHLLWCNCQHWARTVVEETLRPAACLGQE